MHWNVGRKRAFLQRERLLRWFWQAHLSLPFPLTQSVFGEEAYRPGFQSSPQTEWGWLLYLKHGTWSCICSRRKDIVHGCRRPSSESHQQKGWFTEDSQDCGCLWKPNSRPWWADQIHGSCNSVKDWKTIEQTMREHWPSVVGEWRAVRWKWTF